MFLKNTDILTKKAHGLLGKLMITIILQCITSHCLLGQFLTSSVEIDTENNLMKLNGRQPISVRKAQAWPFLNIPDNCWYGADT